MSWSGFLALLAVAGALLTGAATAGADPGPDAASTGDKPAASAEQATPPAQPAPSADSTDSSGADETRPSGSDATQADDTTDESPLPEQPEPDDAPAVETTPTPSRTDKSGVTEKMPATTGRQSAVESASEIDAEPEVAQRESVTVAEPAGDVPATVEPNAAAVAEVPAAATTTHDVSPRTADTEMARMAAPRRATILDAIGSVVLNVVMAFIQFFVGPPVLPPDANVTVRTSTLRIPVAGGRTVTADWYFPDGADPPTRLIYLQHGFGAVGAMYSYTAAALAEQTHSIVVAPTVTSNFLVADGAWLGGTPMQQAVADLFAGDRDALTASASAAAGHEVVLPTRFTLVGHSAGGSLVMGAAADMIDGGALADLTGVVLLDAVDLNETVSSALSKLTGASYRPVLNISSERYVWNMFGRVGDELEAARPGQFNGVMLRGGRHIDALYGGNPVIQFAEYVVAGFSQPQNVEAVRTIAAGWINDLFAGTRTGYYPTPHEAVDVPTSRGAATAVALPFSSDDHIQATPWDAVAEVILDGILGIALYDVPPRVCAVGGQV